jgi:hypothetical protein
MSIFEQAARLNNEGVTSLCNGDIQSAIHKLAESLKWTTNQELSKPATDLNTMKSNTPVYEEDIQTVEIPIMDSDIAFNQAIIIPSTTRGQQQNELDMHVYCAAVIFNLALAHQSKGEETRAEQFYALVLRLLSNDLCHCRTAVVIKLASILNLSQIRIANGDFENAREGLNQQSGFLRRTAWFFEEPEVRGLLMNVLLLTAPAVARAA